MTPAFKPGDRVRRVGAIPVGTVLRVFPAPHGAGGVRARLRVRWDDSGYVGRVEDRQIEHAPATFEINASVFHVAQGLAGRVLHVIPDFRGMGPMIVCRWSIGLESGSFPEHLAPNTQGPHMRPATDAEIESGRACGLAKMALVPFKARARSKGAAGRPK